MTLLVGSIFHMTRKIVSEMTYNVSMGTLNPTIPYHTITSIADNAEDAVVGRILNNPQHVLQAYLDERPQLCYNLR